MEGCGLLSIIIAVDTNADMELISSESALIKVYRSDATILRYALPVTLTQYHCNLEF